MNYHEEVFQPAANEITIAITPRISNTSLNGYASPSPNCRDGWKHKEIIAVNGPAREVLPDAGQSQNHAGTCTLTPANVMSLMASTPPSEEATSQDAPWGGGMGGGGGK